MIPGLLPRRAAKTPALPLRIGSISAASYNIRTPSFVYNHR